MLPHGVCFGGAVLLGRRCFDGYLLGGCHRNRGCPGTESRLLEEVATTCIDLFLLIAHGRPSFSRGDLGLRVGPTLDPAASLLLPIRSEEPRVGKAGVSTLRSRWSPVH